MKYPSRSDYFSSIRNPKFAFRKKDPKTKTEIDLDPSLVQGRAVEKIRPNGMRQIWSAAGSFAIAFKYETFSPPQTWAIRCFYRSNFEVKNHYRQALRRIQMSNCRSYFVYCQFLEEGIRVIGGCYPILKMEWVEGQNLRKFIKANLGNKNNLMSLASLWIKLSQDLLRAGIAHGDLQHGNVLVMEQDHKLSLKLIDYDSLYFASGKSAEDTIKGLGDYQHPLRESLRKRCVEIDFFPQLVIYLSILAFVEDPSLWTTYNLDDREGLLFTRTDFENPESAEIFTTLSRLPSPIPSLALKLQQVCQLTNFKQIPSLDQFISPQYSVVATTNNNGLTPEQKAKLATFSPLPEELVWDPRLGNSNNDNNRSAVAKENAGSGLVEKLVTAKDNLREEGIQELVSQVSTTLVNKLPFLATPLQRFTQSETQIWTTAELCELLGCSVAWCNSQRYQYQDKFRDGTHYYRDGESNIQWTKSGLKQLQRHQSEIIKEVISTTVSTLEVSNRLGISPENLLQVKIKHANQLVEGIHYHTGTKKRYYWTKIGIEKLKKLM